MSKSPKYALALLIAVAISGFTPATADDTLASLQCLNTETGELQPRLGDGNYCSCLALLSDQDLRRLDISSGQAAECEIQTGAINPNPIAPPDDGIITPPDDGTIPPVAKEKGNNGVGNGADPAPPGIGNAGNDGGDVAAGTPVSTSPGNPGGSGTAPGQNK